MRRKYIKKTTIYRLLELRKQNPQPTYTFSELQRGLNMHPNNLSNLLKTLVGSGIASSRELVELIEGRPKRVKLYSFDWDTLEFLANAPKGYNFEEKLIFAKTHALADKLARGGGPPSLVLSFEPLFNGRVKVYFNGAEISLPTIEEIRLKKKIMRYVLSVILANKVCWICLCKKILRKVDDCPSDGLIHSPLTYEKTLQVLFSL